MIRVVCLNLYSLIKYRCYAKQARVWKLLANASLLFRITFALNKANKSFYSIPAKTTEMRSINLEKKLHRVLNSTTQDTGKTPYYQIVKYNY